MNLWSRTIRIFTSLQHPPSPHSLTLLLSFIFFFSSCCAAFILTLHSSVLRSSSSSSSHQPSRLLSPSSHCNSSMWPRWWRDVSLQVIEPPSSSSLTRLHFELSEEERSRLFVIIMRWKCVSSYVCEPNFRSHTDKTSLPLKKFCLHTWRNALF